MCGEQLCKLKARVCDKGSPPRVRGTDDSSRLENKKIRITPACAGNSEAAGLQWQDVEDHPRVCGEQQPSSKTTPP